MLSERSVDLAIRRLRLSKDALRGFYGSSLISPDVRDLVMNYVNNNEVTRERTIDNLRMLKERILENNGNDGNNVHNVKKDKDSLRSSTYIR